MIATGPSSARRRAAASAPAARRGEGPVRRAARPGRRAGNAPEREEGGDHPHHGLEAVHRDAEQRGPVGAVGTARIAMPAAVRGGTAPARRSRPGARPLAIRSSPLRSSADVDTARERLIEGIGDEAGRPNAGAGGCRRRRPAAPARGSPPSTTGEAPGKPPDDTDLDQRPTRTGPSPAPMATRYGHPHAVRSMNTSTTGAVPMSAWAKLMMRLER